MRRLPGRKAIPLPRIPRRAATGIVIAAVLLIPGWFLLRGSPLVAIDHVHITGVSGPQAAEVRQAIIDAAQRQTTLHVDEGQLLAAVQPYPIVAGITVHPHLLHTLDVVVHEHVAVGALANGSRRMAVAGDGTILAGLVTHGLPLVPVGAPPGGRVLADRKALRMVALLAAAPSALRGRVTSVALGAHGLLAHLGNGPDLYFGPAARLQAKWIAAARVLADYSSRGATYLDLRVPERPAAGGLEPTTPTTATTTPGAAITTTPTAPTTTTTTPATTTTTPATTTTYSQPTLQPSQ
jgi:cell division protein FtsQ